MTLQTTNQPAFSVMPKSIPASIREAQARDLRPPETVRPWSRREISKPGLVYSRAMCFVVSTPIVHAAAE
jgi:hypothetical protein